MRPGWRQGGAEGKPTREGRGHQRDREMARQVLKEGTACQEAVRAKAVWPVVAALSLSRW